MNDAPTGREEPQNLRFLRRLVTVLTAVMIFGLLTIVALLVIRFWQTEPSIALPDEIVLPDGTRAKAFTKGTDWHAIVTEDEKILIYDSATSKLEKTITIR